MKALHLSAALALLPAAFACAEAIPVAFEASRYEKMLADSPFVLATPPVAPVEVKDGWWTNLILGPVWRETHEGQERECAIVKSKADISGSFALMGHEEGPDGYQLVKIEWNDDIKQTWATIKKGNESHRIDADQSGATAPPPQQQQLARANPGLPGMNAAGGLRRPAQPAVPQPVIPRPTAVAPAAPVPAQYNQNNQKQPERGERPETDPGDH